MKHPIELACPECGAAAGQACQGRRGDRKAFHRARGSRRNVAPLAAADPTLTDTPIEHLLLSAVKEWIQHEGLSGLNLSTQAPIGPYRADLLIRDGERILVVEADGRAFHSHERAIQHDKRRDRYCAAQGYAVMRFTGPEIHRDPRGCAAEIGTWLRRRT